MEQQTYHTANLFREFSTGYNWTGINAEKALKDISAETAVRHFHDKHLNIAELISHMTCWNIVIAKRLEGKNYQPAPDEDFPGIDQLNEDTWEAIKEKFFDSILLLNDKLLNKNEDELDQPIFEGATSVYRNVHGQISHLHYHLGQVVLLKKLLQ